MSRGACQVKPFRSRLPARLSERPTPSHASLPRPFPQRRPFPRPARIPGTHPPTPGLLICACCVRRLTALDLVAHGGTTLVGTTFTGTFLACATLTGASAHRHLARWHLARQRLARRRLAHSPAPRSSAPRSWTPRSPAPRSPVRRLAVSTCTSSGARRLAREEVRDGWREDARARARCASAREDV